MAGKGLKPANFWYINERKFLRFLNKISDKFHFILIESLPFGSWPIPEAMHSKILLILCCIVPCLLTLGQATIDTSEIKSSTYGGPMSIGVSIGTGGLVNIPCRLFITEKIPVEFSPGLRPVIADDLNKFYMNVALIGGMTFYFIKDYKPSLDRVRMNGLFIKGGGSVGTPFNELIFGAGYSSERFKRVDKKTSVNFELGLGFIRRHQKDVDGQDGTHLFSEKEPAYYPTIFWRIAWHIFSRE